jgi:hypothetical protein
MEDERCIIASLDTLSRTTSNAECMQMLNSGGMSLYALKGFATEYYTRAAMVGVGDTYILGSCGINTS